MVDMNAQVDPERAAEILGKLLDVFGNPEPVPGDLGNNVRASVPIEQAVSDTGQIQNTNTAVTSGGETSSPVPGAGKEITGEYGENRPGGGHPGVDLGVPVGTTVVSTVNGKVTQATGGAGGYGNLVEVTGNDGTVFRYGHLSMIGAKVGDTVRAGSPLGKSGGLKDAPGSGNSTGPHLHFEVRQGDHTIDPMPYLAGGGAIVADSPTPDAPAPVDPTAQAGATIANASQILAGQEPTHGAPAAAPTTATGTATGEPANMDQYFQQLLAKVGAPATAENIQFMRAWMKAEGGSNDNPFNTTQQMPGDTIFNSHGVRRYPSMAVGLQATASTLLQPNMASILQALKSGKSALAAARGLAASPWGTGELVIQILGG